MQTLKDISLATVFSLAVFTAQAESLAEVSEARSRKANTSVTASATSSVSTSNDAYAVNNSYDAYTPASAPTDNEPMISEEIVVDDTPATTTYTTTTNSNYNESQQLQAIQDELQTLRGMLEVTQHELEALQTHQRDLYADLDQRIAEIRQELGKDTTASQPAAVAPSASIDQDQAAYQAAYELVQSQDYPAAIEAFNAYLTSYPEGQYTANAHYWLGESHAIGDDLSKAEYAFKTVVEQYPLHQKAADAMLKLGYVYDAAGNKEKALSTLTEVKQKYPNSSVSRLAEQRLIQIKQSQQLPL